MDVFPVGRFGGPSMPIWSTLEDASTMTEQGSDIAAEKVYGLRLLIPRERLGFGGGMPSQGANFDIS